jgi:beta-phosphoglucomutase
MKKGIIFDLDGVIVSTDEYHYKAWSKLAAEEGIYFDRQINERLRGVSRMESLFIVLEQSEKTYSKEKLQAMAERKNSYYKELLSGLTPGHILSGVTNLLTELETRGIKIAIGSSSRNTPFILEQIGLADRFEVVADGNSITNSKPDPEVFLLAAKLLNISPVDCVIVEDAKAGIDAAKAAGGVAVAVGSAAGYVKADYSYTSMEDIQLADILQ